MIAGWARTDLRRLGPMVFRRAGALPPVPKSAMAVVCSRSIAAMTITSQVIARALVAIGLSAPISLVAAVTSHADTTDDRFLAELRSQGIMDHVSGDHAIQAGRLVCFELDSGRSPADVASEVLNSSSMPAFHAGFFVGASIDAYCPRYKLEIAPS